MSATGRGAVREPEDYYTTPSWCVRRLLEAWRPSAGLWVEPSAGNGAIIRAVNAMKPGIEWRALEIREEERETLEALCPTQIGNFLRDSELDLDAEVVLGNPPYALAWEFIQRAREVYPHAQVCYLLRLAFAASADRCSFMRAHPPDVYVLPDRPSFTGDGGDSADYAWFVWPREVRAARFQVLQTTPLAERKLDCGHEVMIEPRQGSLAL